MIDPKLKRALGQAAKGVEVVAAVHDGVTRAYTSHWVTQVSFEEPIIMARVGEVLPDVHLVSCKERHGELATCFHKRVRVVFG